MLHTCTYAVLCHCATYHTLRLAFSITTIPNHRKISTLLDFFGFFFCAIRTAVLSPISPRSSYFGEYMFFSDFEVKFRRYLIIGTEMVHCASLLRMCTLRVLNLANFTHRTLPVVFPESTGVRTASICHQMHDSTYLECFFITIQLTIIC